MEPYRQQVTEEGDKPIAKAAVRLNGDCRELECNFGMLKTNLCLEYLFNILKMS